MFSIGLYELFIIIIMVLLIVPVRDIPQIIKKIIIIFQKIKDFISKIYLEFEKIGTKFKENDNFKIWEDRVEEKRAEYNINMDSINNLINEEIKHK